MLEATEKLLKDQPAFCKIVRKTNKQYEVKMWLMNTGETDDANVLTINERLLKFTKRDFNHNIEQKIRKFNFFILKMVIKCITQPARIFCQISAKNCIWLKIGVTHQARKFVQKYAYTTVA